MAQCGVNEEVGLVKRHKLSWTWPTPSRAMKLFESEIDRVVSFLRSKRPVRMDLQDFVETYSGSLKVRYQKALDDYLDNGWSWSDAKVSSFVKSERVLDYEYYGCKTIDPRLIHPRKPKFNLLLGSFLKPLSGHVRTHCGLPVMCRSMDLKQRASTLLAHIDLVGECWTYELDAHRFDGHVTPYLLGQEHRVYNGVFGDKELAELLKLQRRSRCTSASGMKYVLESRCSGDYNTSIGNNTLMCAMLMSYFRDRYGDNKKWSFCMDGDNAVLVVSKKIYFSAGDIKKHFMDLGQDVDLERFDSPARTQFCRQRVYHSPDGPTLCRDPRRVLGGLLTVYKNLETVDDYHRQILIGESHVSAGVPLVSEFVHKCLSLLGPAKKNRKYKESDFDYHARHYRGKGVAEERGYSMKNLIDYLDLWDITVSEYYALLDKIANFNMAFEDFDW